MRVTGGQWCDIKDGLPIDIKNEFDKIGLDSYINKTIIHLNIINPESHLIIKKVFLLKGLIETCITITRAMISPQRNKYLSEYLNQYEELSLNLGRWWQFIDENEAFMSGMQAINKRKVWELIEHLYYTFDILIFKSLQSAYIKMTREFTGLNSQFEEQGRRLIKNYDLFAYFVFCEMLNASRVLGAATRTKRATGTKEIIHEKMEGMPELPINPDTELIEKDEEMDALLNNYSQQEELNEQYN